MTVFNRITTAVQFKQGRYYLLIHYTNTDTGEHSHEVSSRYFYTESAATEAATVLAHQLEAKLKEAP